MYPEKLPLDAEPYYYDSRFFSGLKLVHCYNHTDYRIKMHSHQFYEINIVVDGSGRHYIKDVNLEAKLGDVFVIPPETVHGYYSENRLDVYHLLIKNEFFARYKEDIKELSCFDMLFNLEPQIRFTSGKNCNLTLSRNELTDIIHDLETITVADIKQEHLYENILSLEFICKISGILERKLKSQEASDVESAEIIMLMDFIKNNIDKKLTVKELSNIANMSPATLNRRFKEILNTTPMEYVIFCRTEKAKELILKKKHSKTEIAQLCGFYDSAHLNKCLSSLK